MWFEVPKSELSREEEDELNAMALRTYVRAHVDFGLPPPVWRNAGLVLADAKPILGFLAGIKHVRVRPMSSPSHVQVEDTPSPCLSKSTRGAAIVSFAKQRKLRYFLFAEQLLVK